MACGCSSIVVVVVVDVVNICFVHRTQTAHCGFVYHACCEYITSHIRMLQINTCRRRGTDWHRRRSVLVLLMCSSTRWAFCFFAHLCCCGFYAELDARRNIDVRWARTDTFAARQHGHVRTRLIMFGNQLSVEKPEHHPHQAYKQSNQTGQSFDLLFFV